MGWVGVPIGPKRSQIVQIMRAIYAHRDLPVPTDIDHWWHSPQIKYLVEDANAAEPKICIINLGEGEADQPVMSTHFMINLDRLRVTDKFTGDQFVPPQDILDLLGEIRAYAVSKYSQR